MAAIRGCVLFILWVLGCTHGLSDRLEQIVLGEIVDKIADLEERNSNLENTVVALVKSNEAQQKTIDQLTSKLMNGMDKRFVMTPNLPIAFTARLNTHELDHVNPSDVITFDDILTNHGGGLNANSSVFTAPMRGIYIMSCSLLDSQARADGTGVMLHADIVKNGNVVLGRVFAHAEDKAYRDQGAQTIFVELQTGDRVWVKNWDSRDLSVGGELYSTFSGYLLWPLE